MRTQIIILKFLLLISAINLQGQNKDIEFLNLDYSNKQIDRGLVQSKKAVGGNVYIGTGILNGNISEYFSNHYFIGFNFDIYRKRFVFQGDYYIGYGVTKKELEFNSDQKWERNKAAISALLGGNVGYSVFENRKIKIVPLAGIGFNLMSSTIFGDSKFSEHEPFLPHYKLGIYIDFKRFVPFYNHFKVINEYDNYTAFRLSFGMTDNIGIPKFPKFYRGSIFYITIGICIRKPKV